MALNHIEHQAIEDPQVNAPARSRIVRGINRLLAIGSHGANQGNQHGGENGSLTGASSGHHEGNLHGGSRGELNGELYGHLRGHHSGHQRGYHPRELDGVSPASSTGTELAEALGGDLFVVNGVVHACSPGTRPPPTTADHAAAFLRWLQAQSLFCGNEVPSRLLEERLFPYYASISKAPQSWRSIARHFVDLPGVQRRQLDGRVGPDRIGSSATVYRIPLPGTVSPLRR
jgi:hypothetical protein